MLSPQVLDKSIHGCTKSTSTHGNSLHALSSWSSWPPRACWFQSFKSCYNVFLIALHLAPNNPTLSSRSWTQEWHKQLTSTACCTRYSHQIQMTIQNTNTKRKCNIQELEMHTVA
jgi:hypothetical protein